MTSTLSYLAGGFIALRGSVPCLDNQVRHGNPFLPGIAVLERDGPIVREVLEYSEAALDTGLFEAPAGYTRVDRIHADSPKSWFSRMEMEWYSLERAFESWFE